MRKIRYLVSNISNYCFERTNTTVCVNCVYFVAPSQLNAELCHIVFICINSEESY